jgi:transcriptional regulator with XRE-family HTH domain
VGIVTRNGNESDPRKVFGQALRHLRTTAGLSQEQLGRAAFISGDMIAKVERGDRSPSAKVVESFEGVDELRSNGMLTLLWDQLGVFARPFPGWFARWPDAEATARTLRSFEPLIIPGLLQTEAYARALLSTRVGESEDQIDVMVAARLARQTILDREKPPTCWFMVDEGVLHRCVGSPVIMKEQLIQLAGLAQRPDIVVQVVPLEAGAHQGLNGGAFVIADLPNAASVAYQDTALAGQILEAAEDIESLMLTWDTLRSEALPRAASMALIEKAQETWT